MSAKEITGISMSSVGMVGIIYSAIGLFDSTLIYRNPLVGIVFVAMIMLTIGVMLMKPDLEEA
jgi:hypothetical protein